MSDAPLMLGVSGLRGVVGQSLTPELATRYAAAVGSWLRERIGRTPFVVVGRDGRAGGEMIAYAAVAGLQSTGARVCRLGVAMTPTVGVATDMLSADAALIITASHNPQEWNGIKILIRERSWEIAGDEETDACAPPADIANEIIARFEANRVTPVGSVDLAESLEDHDAPGFHCQRVTQAASALFGVESFWDMLAGKVGRVVLDAVNASGVEADALFFEDTACRMVQLHGEATGLFPHAPEPTKENLSAAGGLCDAVSGLSADVGFAQDPDADRLAIIDELGNYIGEEMTLVLCAQALLEAMGDKARGRVICTNQSTSRMIDDVAMRYGARVVRTPVGEAHVVAAMREHNAVLGGEGNGGVIWPAVTFVRDSLSAMALVLGLRARTGLSLSSLAAGRPSYAMIKRKAPLADRSAILPALERVTERYSGEKVDCQDGVRIDFADRWVHVRASNTEPILRVIAEAPDQASAQTLADEILAIVG
jgi:phosphomannomutase